MRAQSGKTGYSFLVLFLAHKRIIHLISLFFDETSKKFATLKANKFSSNNKILISARINIFSSLP